MATKSILKNVVIKENASVRNLIRAMDLAEKRKNKNTEIFHKVSEAKKEELKDIFMITQ